MSMSIAGDSPFAHLQQKSYEWYTPAKYLHAAREVMGAIDLDPASSTLANTVIQAETYYDEETNGLDKPWSRDHNASSVACERLDRYSIVPTLMELSDLLYRPSY